MKGKIVTFGEIMLRLSPYGHYRIQQATTMDATFAGSEANVAVCLANLEMDSAFISKVPNNEIGKAAINSLRTFGVDVSKVLWGGKRIGIFYLEKGASQRPSKVIYDREYSSVSLCDPSEYNWNDIFRDCTWFHFSGITPALSAVTAAACLDACKMAKKMGLKVSVDINYRKSLWGRDEARKVMTELMQYVDICFANEEDIADVFGINPENSDVTQGIIDLAGYRKIAQILIQQFSLEKVVISLRNSISANFNKWAGMSYNGEDYYLSKQYDINIIDRVGSGDTFAAGYIYAQTMGYDGQSSIEFAVAASCLNHSLQGDYNIISASEVHDLMGGDVTGRVKR